MLIAEMGPPVCWLVQANVNGEGTTLTVLSAGKHQHPVYISNTYFQGIRSQSAVMCPWIYLCFRDWGIHSASVTTSLGQCN